MADKKVDVTEIEKLRPELLDKSVAELERQMTEIQMALDRKRAIEEEKHRAANNEKAAARMDAVVDGLKWLHENNYLTDKVTAMFTTSGGVFAPHLNFKKPR